MSTQDRGLFIEALKWLSAGRKVALATVVETWGSAPRLPGSHLLVDGKGNFVGSVSGGCVEADVITEAADVIANGRPKLLEFSVVNDVAWRSGLACGGSVRILVAPLLQAAANEFLPRLLDDIQARRKVALVTELESGAHSLVYPADSGTARSESFCAALSGDKSLTVTENGRGLFVNVFNPAIRIIVVGAVHVTQALAEMARQLAYETIVVDPRSAFATASRFAEVPIFSEWPDEALPKIGLDDRTALVTLAHNPQIDDPALIAALQSDAFYVGALGSRKTHAARVERLRAAGIAAEDIERIHAPIGLDIGAQGAAEIALSIIAEIAAASRGKLR